MELHILKIDNPQGFNLILGQAHFIKTVEDLHETLVQTSNVIQFGIAFCEASGPCLIRSSGNNDQLKELAERNAALMAAGHSFIIFLDQAFPIQVLQAVKNVNEVCQIYCATANPVEVVLAKTEQGSGILGVIDGFSPKGLESERDVSNRKKFLRDIGYKL